MCPQSVCPPLTVSLSLPDSRLQSHMNEIEKSEHKSSEEGAKGFDWTPDAVLPNGSECGPVDAHSAQEPWPLGINIH